MPRRALPASAQKALAYWGVIELAAEAHAPTADLWEWIRQAAADLKLASPGVTVQGVSVLRGYAGQIQSRAALFAALAGSKRVTARVMSDPPWARSLGEQRAMPKWAVRFKHTYIQNGAEITEWRTSMFGGRINHTARQVRDEVELDALNLARKYGTAHVGVDSLQVMSV